MAGAPVFVPEGVPGWLFTAAAIPFAALLIPGSVGERELRFHGFSLLAVATVAVSIALMFAIARIPNVSENLALFVGMSLVAGPYALIIHLYRLRSRVGENEQADESCSHEPSEVVPRKRPLNDA